MGRGRLSEATLEQLEVDAALPVFVTISKAFTISSIAG